MGSHLPMSHLFKCFKNVLINWYILFDVIFELEPNHSDKAKQNANNIVNPKLTIKHSITYNL